jgi:hypothetical protein
MSTLDIPLKKWMSTNQLSREVKQKKVQETMPMAEALPSDGRLRINGRDFSLS